MRGRGRREEKEGGERREGGEVERWSNNDGERMRVEQSVSKRMKGSERRRDK